MRWRFRRWIEREVRPSRFAAYGTNTVVHPPLTVAGAERVELGDRTFVLAGATLVAGAGGAGGRVRIGSGTYLGRDLTIISAAEVVIGDDVMGSDRLYIADVEHGPGPGGRGGRVLLPPRPVRIEDGVFLGTGAMVLPGVTVGARSLVAAGAVVTEDVPAGSVAAGNPARVVRRHDPASGTWTTDAAPA